MSFRKGILSLVVVSMLCSDTATLSLCNDGEKTYSPLECNSYLICEDGYILKKWCPNGQLYDRTTEECRNKEEVECEHILTMLARKWGEKTKRIDKSKESSDTSSDSSDSSGESVGSKQTKESHGRDSSSRSRKSKSSRSGSDSSSSKSDSSSSMDNDDSDYSDDWDYDSDASNEITEVPSIEITVHHTTPPDNLCTSTPGKETTVSWHSTSVPTTTEVTTIDTITDTPRESSTPTTKIPTVTTEYRSEPTFTVPNVKTTDGSTRGNPTTTTVIPTTIITSTSTIKPTKTPEPSTAGADGCQGTCPPNNTVPTYLPHSDCGKFCQCDWGAAYILSCPDGLHFNPAINVCDWPWNVGCQAV